MEFTEVAPGKGLHLSRARAAARDDVRRAVPVQITGRDSHSAAEGGRIGKERGAIRMGATGECLYVRTAGAAIGAAHNASRARPRQCGYGDEGDDGNSNQMWNQWFHISGIESLLGVNATKLYFADPSRARRLLSSSSWLRNRLFCSITC